MDNGGPYGRRRAKAITISQTMEAKRQAALTKLILGFGAIVTVAETVLLIHRMLALPSP